MSIIRTFAYLLIVVGFLIMVFFTKYTGNLIPYPLLFGIAGIGMVIAGTFLLGHTVHWKVKKKVNHELKRLLESGEKIYVDFSKCEIRCNDYLEEQERQDRDLLYSWRASAWDNASGYGQKSVKMVSVVQSCIVFTNKLPGRTEMFFSEILSIDKETLAWKLREQKGTTLHVDPNDRNHYYFDLSFLFE